VPRSSKKGVFVTANLVKKVLAMRATNSKRPIQTYDRRCTVFPEMVGLSFLVHKGNGFELVHITPEKVGHKLGEFALTRTYRGHRADDKKGKGARK
jgi:small subunit ribosomal protein S19